MDATTTSSGNPQTPTCCACDAGCTNDSSGGTGAASGGSSGAPVNAGTGGLSAPGGGGITGGPMTGGGGIGVGPATGGGGITGGPMTGGGGITGGPMTGGGGITGGPMTGGGGITGGPMTGGGGITGGPMTGGGGITGGPMTGGGGITGGPMTGGGGITGGPATGGGGLSTAFGHSLSFSNSLGGSSDGTNGNGWFIHQLPTMTFQPSGGVGVIGNPANALWFNPAQSDGTHPPSFPFRASLNYGAVPAQGGSGRDANATGSGTAASQFTLTKDDGSALRYNPGGQLQSVADAGGNTGTAEYNPRQQLTHMRLAQADGTPTSVNVYAYVASGPNVDQLESVTLQVGGQDVSRQRFTYYGVNENYGNVNDLKHIFTEQRDQASGQWSLLGTSYHRYYKPNEGGYVSGLRFLVGPEAYARMSDLGIPPDYATDPTIANFADLYVEYDMQRRVSLQRASAGAYTYRFAYTISNHPVGTNSWRTKTVETLPDGNENHIYVNAQGQAILRVFVDVATGNEWCTYWRYDAQGRGLLRAEPSAVEGYDEALPGLATLKAHEGLVHTYEYYDATSVMAPGYFKAEGVQQGGAGEVTKIRSVNYVGLSGAGIGSVWLLDASTLYQSEVDGGSEPATTSHSYQWYEGTLQPSQRTTTWPVVPTSQNGSGLANHRTEVYDRSGRVTWLKDERGFLFFTAYDPITGAVTQQIQDVKTQGRTDVPNGWTTPAGGGLNLTTDYESDLLGRTTRKLGPVHTIDLGGTATAIRRANWTVYQDAARQTTTGQGYVQVDGSGPVLMNPVAINRGDREGLVFDQIRATRGTGVESPGALTAADVFAQDTWCRWTRGLYNALGQQSARRVYFLIPTAAGDQGAKDVNYNESVYGYDLMGRRNRSVTPGGTITFMTYAAPGRSTGSWVGTNGAYATNQDPTGGQQGQQAGNNLVIVSASEYDQGLPGGDGNLTKSTLYADASTTRVTTYMYDFRDRRIGVLLPAGRTTVYTYDNRSLIIHSDERDSTSDKLLSKSATSFDVLGRIYQGSTYSVDPTMGTVGNVLTNRTWYNPAGNAIKRCNGGSQTSGKIIYDGVGRATIAYVTSISTESAYPHPISVTGETVVQQIATSYDAASNAIVQITHERNHNATGNGVLRNSGLQPQSRVIFVGVYPDALGRAIAQANYGTNAGATWTRSNTIPTASSAVLVYKMKYDAQGNFFQQIDPSEIVTHMSFDQAGRQTKRINNVVVNGTNPDQNQVTDYVYHPNGRLFTLTAKNSVTGDQTTSCVYGTNLSNSGIACNDLLAQKGYPASSVSNPDQIIYAYNRLGELKKSTEDNGSTHTFLYDGSGRLQHDCVENLGSGMDGAVRRVSRTYEARGLLQGITSYDNATPSQGSVVNDVFLTYDGFGQLVADYQAHDGAVDVSSTPSVQYTYADGSANTVRRTGMTYPSGRQLALSYGPSGSIDDGLSRLESIVDAAAGTAGTTLASFAYLGLDTRVQIAYPEPGVHLTLIGTPGGDGGDQYRGLDRFGRLIDQRWTNTAATSDLERVQFGYDRASNKTWRHNPVAATAGVARDEFYGYDGLSQLKARQQGTLNAGHTGLSGPPTAEEDFTFDPTGNWTHYQAQGGGSPPLDQTRTHDVDNQITALDGSSTLVGYDHAGNMTTMPQPKDGTASCTVTWDAWNRPVEVQSGGTTVATYAYDGAMRRIRKTTGAGRQAVTSNFFYSDQWKVLEERVGSRTGASVEQFVWCGCSADKLVLRDLTTDLGDTARLYAMDDGKDVTALCNAAGAVQERFGYAAFGAPAFLDACFGPSTASSFHWQTLFCGYRFDADTGLYQVRYRYLHAQLGRWLSRDPIYEMNIVLQIFLHSSGVIGKSLSLDKNLVAYNYVDNAPYRWVDTLGLKKCSCEEQKSQQQAIINAANEWNKTSPVWSWHNQCVDQSAALMTYLMNAFNEGDSCFDYSLIAGQSPTFGGTEFGAFNHVILQLDPRPCSDKCDISSFTLDPYKDIWPFGPPPGPASSWPARTGNPISPADFGPQVYNPPKPVIVGTPADFWKQFPHPQDNY